MKYPIYPHKHKFDSLSSARSLVQYIQKYSPALKNIPQRVVLCFSPAGPAFLRKQKTFQSSLSTHKLGFSIDVHKQKKQTTAVVSHFGFGAPAAVLCMEKLIALGVKEFISAGLMGALTEKLPVGTGVLCKKAFRDEGVSYHYRAPSLTVKAKTTRAFFQLKEKLDLKAVDVWSTDAPFRETKKELEYFLQKGVQCVDMESSAVLSLAQYYKVSAYCVGVVSDHILPDKGWRLNFFHKKTFSALKEILAEMI